MLLPGAYMSTQPPQLEYEACASVLVLAATVRAELRLDGEYPHASEAELPAATATVTPASITRCTASFSVCENPPLKLMFATAGRTRFAVTQSRPATTPLVVPLPLQSRTRTE